MNKEQKPFEISILTRPPLSFSTLPKFLKSVFKRWVKKFMFFITRSPRFLFYSGPEAVGRSLRVGLGEIGANFRFNPCRKKVSKVVGVLAGKETLAWALAQKKVGKIKTLVAGPNIVNSPVDENRIIEDPLIDKIVVPSKWNKDWWVNFDQYLESKIVPWPAGVEDRGMSRDDSGYCLVYIKNASEEVYKPIVRFLWERKIPIKVMHYGHFSRGEYFKALSGAKFMIYFSQAESQGIALHEAWMANVPTIIWNPGFFEIGERNWKDPLMSAPYFDEKCGMLFASEDEFSKVLSDFLNKYLNFLPREYSLSRFTDGASADAYMAIVKELVGRPYEDIDNNTDL